MKIVFGMLFVFLLLISGCDLKEAGSDGKNNMPKEIPNDFDFLVQFGVQSKNEINTFDNIVIKDLIAEGTATAKITFTEEEMKKIYQKMRKINITEPKKLIPEKINCMKTPYGKDKWKITLNDETKSFTWSGEYCETTKDAKELIELRNYILNLVEGKEEYKKLPEAKGAYL